MTHNPRQQQNTYFFAFGSGSEKLGETKKMWETPIIGIPFDLDHDTGSNEVAWRAVGAAWRDGWGTAYETKRTVLV